MEHLKSDPCRKTTKPSFFSKTHRVLTEYFENYERERKEKISDNFIRIYNMLCANVCDVLNDILKEMTSGLNDLLLMLKVEILKCQV